MTAIVPNIITKVFKFCSDDARLYSRFSTNDCTVQVFFSAWVKKPFLWSQLWSSGPSAMLIGPSEMIWFSTGSLYHLLLRLLRPLHSGWHWSKQIEISQKRYTLIRVMDCSLTRVKSQFSNPWLQSIRQRRRRRTKIALVPSLHFRWLKPLNCLCTRDDLLRRSWLNRSTSLMVMPSTDAMSAYGCPANIIYRKKPREFCSYLR